MKTPRFLQRSVQFAVMMTAGLLGFASPLFAATLSLNPSRAQLTVGDTFSVQVTVDSQGKPVNNAEGILHFPAGSVSVESIDSANSIFGLWPEQPAYSNTSGIVSFNGGAVNPGYSGPGGRVVSVTLKALKAGAVPLTLSDAYVRANDGLGTDVLSGLSGTTVVVLPKPVQEETPKIPVVDTLTPQQSVAGEAPDLFSLTNPDQTKWYNDRSIQVGWTIPAGARGIQFTFGGQPGTVPSGATQTLTHKEYPNVRDGVSYFHARYRVSTGWSPIAYYAFHIDTVAPESLSVTPVTQPDGSQLLGIRAADETSGIEYFTVAVGDGAPVAVPANGGAAEYSVPAMPYIGTYQIAVAAYDRAGNVKTTKLELNVKTLAAPKIEAFPAEVTVGEPIKIAGSASFANRQVLVFVKLPDNKVEQYLVDTDEAGRFTLDTEDTRLLGYHEVWAQFTNERGEKSYESAHMKTLAIASQWQQFMNFVSHNALTIILAIFALIGLICVIAHVHLQVKAYHERKRSVPPRVSS